MRREDTAPGHASEVRPPSPCVYVRFLPRWEQIDPLRNYVETYFQKAQQPSQAARAALLVHELLENAVKYGDMAQKIELQVGVSPDERTLEVRVGNNAVSSRIAVLKRSLSKTEAHEPSTAFRKAMEQLSTAPAAGSMLGLARLRTEAEADLDIEIDGNRVTVIARSALSSSSAA